MATNPQSATETPDDIFRIATGFMKAKYLFIANEIGLFEALSGGPGTLDDLAQRLAVPRRTLRIVADALITLGLLTRQGDRYQNSPAAQGFLGGPSDLDLRPFLRFWDRLSYREWERFAASVRTGEAPSKGNAPSEEDEGIYLAGIEAIGAACARPLIAAYDLGRHRRMLEIGGWNMAFLGPLLQRYPHLEATLLTMPQFIERARAKLANDPDAGRVQIVEGDYLFDPIPAGHDVVILGQIMHAFSPEQNIKLLAHLRSGVEVGTRLLLVDFWTDRAHTDPPFAAVMAGEFQLFYGQGDVYSGEEVSDWLGGTGWELIEQRSLEGAAGLIVAEAR